jgi:hypothetical protein
MKSVLKSFLTIIVLLCAHLKIIAQSHVGNVGIGIIQPLTRLHIEDTLTQTLGRSTIYLHTISGLIPDSNYRGIDARINGTTGFARAIQGYSYGQNEQQNVGVIGFASNAVQNRGIYGVAQEENYHSNGSNYGVVGFGDRAITNVGVYGLSRIVNENTNGINYGSVGVARNSNYSNISVGAYSEIGNTSDSVQGDNFGLSAKATSTSFGTNYGIYSEAYNATTNYAGFFNGDVTITGTLSNPSDAKLKTNIKPLSKATDILNRLRPVEYEYKKSIEGKSLILPKNHQYGFIAQELQTVLPDLVAQQKINLASTGGGLSEDGLPSNKVVQKSETQAFLGINYMSLIPILVQGLKEQDERIKMLEKKILEMSKQ